MTDDIKFDFDDILITPTVISDIESRTNINIYDKNGFLPIFTAPMDTVVDEKNVTLFENNKIYSILPRKKDFNGFSENKFIWKSYGLDEFIHYFITNQKANSVQYGKIYALIDIANGHMKKLLDTVKLAKEIYGDKLVLMVGNIANPKTYILFSEAGADFIRVGIGSGSGCLTSQQTSIGYPMASLIKETYEESLKLNKPAKIVADGGFKKYSDIIKGLALGSDYIMIGGMLNKALESCADTYMSNKKHENWTEPGELVNQYDTLVKDMFKNGTEFYKKFRGMSTKDVQKTLGNKLLKTSEGVSRINKVEYTLDGWVENFKHYLSSSMSYCGASNLNEYIGQVNYIKISQNALNRFKK